jgi:GntR family transcriptional regulator
MSALPESPSLTFSPLYKQVVGLLVRGLESGEWKPGVALPSEADLALRFGVSQGTVRKALDELVGGNLLIRRQGKGTFVATHGDPEAFSRFLCLAPDEGELPPFKNVPLACWRAKAGPEVARQLPVGPGAPVIIVRRLLRFGDDPVVFDEIYLPGELFAGLTMDVLRSAESSLYSLFESRYGVRAIRANERLRAVSADKASADALLVPEGSPLLLAERVTYTFGDRPVEWRRGFYATRNYHYHNELG